MSTESSAAITDNAVPTAANLGTKRKFAITSTVAAHKTEKSNCLSFFNGKSI